MAADDTPSVSWLLFSPSGRIGRQPYVMSIALWLVLQAAAIPLMFMFERNDAGLIGATLALLATSFGTFVSLIMLTIKRSHDMGFPAVCVVLLFIPVASIFALACFLFWPSGPPNQYGQFTNRPK